MTLAVTGATGYIGSRLCTLAAKAGHDVLSLSRQPPAHDDVAWLPFDLFDNADLVLPANTLALVHLAATTQSATFDVEAERRSALRLIAACRMVGARMIFISSQTAAPQAPTDYGRSKWLIEDDVLESGGLVIRPGQVYGGPPKALFGTLVQLVRKLPLLPAFLPAPLVQPVHVDDLARAIVSAATRAELEPQRLQVAHPTPVTFTRFLRGIAHGHVRAHRFFLPVPTILILAANRLMGARTASTMGLDRLESLFKLPPMDTAASLKRLDIQLRPFPDDMRTPHEPPRRDQLREAQAFLSYCLREKASPGLMKRYVRAVESLRPGLGALHLPALLSAWPWTLACAERCHSASSDLGRELNWRLNAALLLSEASPQGARRFLRTREPSGWITHALVLLRSLFAEALIRLLSPLLRPWVTLRLTSHTKSP